MSATRDPRGFAYSLEAVRKRRQWQLDASLAQLAELQRYHSECDAKCEQLDAQCVAQGNRAAHVWAARPDPVAQRRVLMYLSNLHQSRVDAERERASVAELLTQARRKCAAQQQRVEVLDRHRDESITHHVVQEYRKSAAQADQDWSSRSLRARIEGSS